MLKIPFLLRLKLAVTYYKSISNVKAAANNVWNKQSAAWAYISNGKSHTRMGNISILFWLDFRFRFKKRGKERLEIKFWNLDPASSPKSNV